MPFLTQIMEILGSFRFQLQYRCGPVLYFLCKQVMYIIVRVMPDDISVLSHSLLDFSDELDWSNAFQNGCEPDINITWSV